MGTLADFSLRLQNSETLPILVGGMGVNISTAELALSAAKCGGIGHISDALASEVSDKLYRTTFSKDKYNTYKENKFDRNKDNIFFDLEKIAQATKNYVSDTMSKKKGMGMVFVNCMEKLTMNNPRETLKARLNASLDAGIDGITLSAGLHLPSFGLMSENRRFRDAKLGIIVSSVRALKAFLSRAKKYNRLPDYTIVEGPLAGGHLGFGDDWREFNLTQIFKEVVAFIRKEELPIKVIPAGGIFTGGNAVKFMEMGADAVQVATRFTMSEECGLPTRAKQAYLQANEDEIVVRPISPTGYLMRILTTSPAINSGIRPNCENLGYLLNAGKCAYLDSYYDALEAGADPKTVSISEKVCLCTHMKNYKLWTCGANTFKLKDTTLTDENGAYRLAPAELIFEDYLRAKDDEILLPELLKAHDAQQQQVELPASA